MLKLLMPILLFVGSVAVDARPQGDHEVSKQSHKKQRKIGVRAPGEDPCLGGRGLAAFANGDDFNMGGMIAFLTDSSCQERQSYIVRDALSQRIAFNEEPFRLRQVASTFNPGSLQSVEQANQTLLRMVPVVLKDHPMTNDAILPILGQVAVLSQSAARKIISEMIQNELIAADTLMKTSNREKGVLAGDLAQTLLAYGANSPVIASEMAEATEEMALSAQVNSLARILSGLAEAAQADGTLIPTLETTVGGARRGVEKAQNFADEKNNLAVLKVFFERIKMAFLAEPEFDGVSADYDRALKVLIKNRSFNQTGLREAWKECLKVLATNRLQASLAQAMALSLTGDLVYLNAQDKTLLFSSANNYKSIAVAVQRSFLAAWNEAWANVNQGRIPPQLFNQRKERYFTPTVGAVLELEPDFIEHEWLRFVWEKGFVKDEQVESRFPKLLMVQLKRREQALKNLNYDSSFSNMVSAFIENMEVARDLSSVELPALHQWIKKQESPPVAPE